MRGIGIITACAALLFAAPPAGGQTDDDARLDRQAQIQQCRALLKQSLVFADTGDNDSALVLLAEALKCDPKNPDVFFHTGRLRLHTGDTTDATAVLQEGVAKAPLSTRLKLLLARVRIAAGAHEEAAELVKSVLAVKPREGEAHYLSGLIALAQADTVQAVDAWHRALQIALEGQAP